MRAAQTRAHAPVDKRAVTLKQEPYSETLGGAENNGILSAADHVPERAKPRRNDKTHNNLTGDKTALPTAIAARALASPKRLIQSGWGPAQLGGAGCVNVGWSSSGTICWPLLHLSQSHVGLGMLVT